MRTPLLTARALVRAGAIGPIPPRQLGGVLRAQRRWGRTPAGGIATAAVRRPDQVAITDEDGEITWRELHERSNAMAHALAEAGAGPGRGVGLLARNHRGFVEALLAASKLGADAVLLNTGFSAPQLADVAQREGLAVLVCDDEFTNIAGDLRVLPSEAPGATDREPEPPAAPGRQIILTSGTTGTPKGARRPPVPPLEAIASFLDRVPIREGMTHFVSAPMFHAWGFAHMGLCLMLGCRIVLRRRFDPEDVLATVAAERPDAIALVPVMAQRILELPEATRGAYDCSSLRVAAFGGSAIPGDLAVRFMDAFGDVVYNTYGSTEVAVVSVAAPADLRADPATAGRPVFSAKVALLDDDGRPVPDGEAGRIFVGSRAAFEGYTGGGGKALEGSLMSTGDMGRFDASGRLTIEGRDDDMIVSGGENVFPREVEDVIAGLDGVREVAVIGVPDDEFGQRLKAFVVGEGLTADDVRAAVRASLARYKVPRDVEFLAELPRTTTGKVLKRTLHKPE